MFLRTQILTKLTIVVSIAGFAFVACPGMALAKESVDKKMELGNLLFFNGNIDGAINAFKAAEVIDPNFFDAHYTLLNIYMQKPDLPGAIAECKEIMRLKPKYKDIHMIMGNLLRNNNDMDGAAEEFKKAIEDGSDPATIHSVLGMTLLQKGDMDGAVDHLHQAIGSSKKSFPDAHLALGIALFKKGDKDGALKEIDMAISQSDKNATAHNTKGDMLSNDSKWKEALSEYEKAIKDDAKFSAAYAGKGTAHLQLGDIDSARTAFTKAKELNPQDKNVVYTLALLLEKQGDIPGAIAEFENAIASENDSTAAAQIRMHINQLKQQTGFGGTQLQPGTYSGPSLLDGINSHSIFGH